MNVVLRPLFSALHLAGARGLLISLVLPVTAADVYHQAFWGGLWGITLCAPLHKVIKSFWARAFLLGAPLPALLHGICPRRLGLP